MKRRAFSKALMTTITSYALMDSLFAVEGISKRIRPLTDHWVIQLNEYCLDLHKTAITPSEWQSFIGQLYQKIPLADLLQFIDFDNLIKGFTYPDLGVNTRQVNFPKLAGLPSQTVFYKKVFGMKKDRAIIPHGHTNMASAHLVINGGLHLRHYEKLASEDEHLIIKPTVDRAVKRGDFSSISDQKDNVHWFIANTETAFTFDVILLDLAGQPFDIQNIDIYAKQDLRNGTLRVPVLDVQTALKKYGKHTHH